MKWVLFVGLALQFHVMPSSEAAGHAEQARIHVSHLTRVADPKLPGGGVAGRFSLVGVRGDRRITVDVALGDKTVRQICSRVITGRTEACFCWDGKDGLGRFMDTGEYVIRIRDARGVLTPVEASVNIVRLGITEIAALPNEGEDDEWQMVYFLKGDKYDYYVTPKCHEYRLSHDKGDTSDLDRNDGRPRPVEQVHTATDSPVLDGKHYAKNGYNYPLCYLMGAKPRLRVRAGCGATSHSGERISCGYQITGIEIRVSLTRGGTEISSSKPIHPGDFATLSYVALPQESTQTNRDVTFAWQYRQAGSSLWRNICGRLTVPLRFYTQIGRPQLDATLGSQYAGPWVEVIDYHYQWQRALAARVATPEELITTHVHGFFGGSMEIPSPINGARFATNQSSGYAPTTREAKTIDLPAFFDTRNRDSGTLACQDCAAATSLMLSMSGVKDIRRLTVLPGTGRPMFLNFIWGIGDPRGFVRETPRSWLYQDNSHSFAYHHTVSRDFGKKIIDTCVTLDVDSASNDPPILPGRVAEMPLCKYGKALSWLPVKVDDLDLPEIKIRTAPKGKQLKKQLDRGDRGRIRRGFYLTEWIPSEEYKGETIRIGEGVRKRRYVSRANSKRAFVLESFVGESIDETEQVIQSWLVSSQIPLDPIPELGKNGFGIRLPNGNFREMFLIENNVAVQIRGSELDPNDSVDILEVSRSLANFLSGDNRNGRPRKPEIGLTSDKNNVAECRSIVLAIAPNGADIQSYNWSISGTGQGYVEKRDSEWVFHASGKGKTNLKLIVATAGGLTDTAELAIEITPRTIEAGDNLGLPGRGR
jgi:hypothetical protein